MWLARKPQKRKWCYYKPRRLNLYFYIPKASETTSPFLSLTMVISVWRMLLKLSKWKTDSGAGAPKCLLNIWASFGHISLQQCLECMECCLGRMDFIWKDNILTRLHLIFFIAKTEGRFPYPGSLSLFCLISLWNGQVTKRILPACLGSVSACQRESSGKPEVRLFPTHLVCAVMKIITH